MTAAEFALKIKRAKRVNGQWTGLCPEHDDKNPSLSWRDGDKGLVITCLRGCPTEKIVTARSLTMADLFYEQAPAAGSASRRIVATYDYRDDNGALLFQTVRTEPKGFYQRRPNGQDGLIKNLKGVRRVVYRLPEIIAEMNKLPAGVRCLVIVEGEKDTDLLWSLGIPATTNPMGVGKWTEEYTDQLKAAGVETVILLRDNDVPGDAHRKEVAVSCARGLTVKLADLPGLRPLQEKHGEDVSDWLAMGHSADELKHTLDSATTAEPVDLNGSVRLQDQEAACGSSNPWAAAKPVDEFLGASDGVTDWLDELLFARGAISEFFSPRGLGKTILTYLKAVELAKRGIRVLLLDRDNPPGLVRQRLRACGAAGLPTLRVMMRDQVPALTDTTAWRTFPFSAYDLVIIDSLDASTEGVGEKDSSKPSKALAALLDLARRDDGPAVLVLGNTVRTGAHSRGSGVIEDRADIVYELRDATDLRPTGTRDWWQELPPADAGSWGQRASRRKRRTVIRLALIATKFRPGMEPEPFVLELNMATEPWSLRDVSREIVGAGDAAREEAAQDRERKVAAAVTALVAEVARRAQTGKPMYKDVAVSFLTDRDIKRQEARVLIEGTGGGRWELKPLQHQRGNPVAMVPPGWVEKSRLSSAEMNVSKTPRKQKRKSPGISADLENSGRRKSGSRQAAETGAIRDTAAFPPSAPDSRSDAANALESVELEETSGW